MNNLVNPAGQQLAVQLKVEGIKTHRTFKKFFGGKAESQSTAKIDCTIFIKKTKCCIETRK